MYLELRVAPEDRPPAGVRKVKMHDQGIQETQNNYLINRVL